MVVGGEKSESQEMSVEKSKRRGPAPNAVYVAIFGTRILGVAQRRTVCRPAKGE